MVDQIDSSHLVLRPNYDQQLLDFETALLKVLGQYDLPTEPIFVSIDERLAVSQNIERVLGRLSSNKKRRSVYLSKFIAATASGLFDAALNYLWDETIAELRLRVAKYDLSYFYDNTVKNPEKRKKLTSAEDLVNIDDSELINGAKAIEMISELGYKHLDYIRYMRNWASAAHPNQNEITGLQLVGWLETCLKEVIALPESSVATEIKQLLANIKTNSIDDAEAKGIAAFFLNLSQEQVNNLASGFLGIYTRSDTTPRTRRNVHRLLPYLWNQVDEPTRQQSGLKHDQFAANGYKEERQLARQFLELVSAGSYISDDFRAVEIENVIENLLSVHRSVNNFYNEPPFARELQRLVGPVGKVPSKTNKKYVLCLVEVFLTNRHGIARNAEPIYLSLIGLFDPMQALIAVLSFNDVNIASKLQFRLCREKYYELLKMLKTKVSSVPVKELISDIETFTGDLDIMKDTYQFKQKVANLEKIIG